MKASFKFDTMILMEMIKNSRSSQNSKFVMSFKKEVRDEVDFLHAVKHQSFL